MSTLDFDWHLSEADVKSKHKPRVYVRRDCAADGDCQRPPGRNGVCHYHTAQARRRRR